MDNIIVEASKFHSNSAVAHAELKSSVATDDFLRILDDHVKKPHENPSYGIVLCKSSNKELVEYVIQDYHKPMGVATYKTSAEMPENLRKAMPDNEDIRKLLTSE